MEKKAKYGTLQIKTVRVAIELWNELITEGTEKPKTRVIKGLPPDAELQSIRLEYPNNIAMEYASSQWDFDGPDVDVELQSIYEEQR